MKARFAVSVALVVPVAFAACGSDNVQPTANENPPDAAIFDPGNGGPGGGYGSGSGSGGTPHDAAVPPPPVCPTADEQCPESFGYPFNSETSVALCGN